MKLRLMGTEEELKILAAYVEHFFEVQNRSKFYPNRGPHTVFGRVYIEVATPPIEAWATLKALKGVTL